MSRKQYSLSKQLVVATALALGASGVAIADDSSMSRFGGDSYAYFTNQQTLDKTAANPAWRQSHPKGLTNRELQTLSSSSLSAAASNPPVFANMAAADLAWHQSHRNGLTEQELRALSSSSLAMWNESGTATEQSSMARSPSQETFSVRLATLFRPGR